MLPSKMTPQQKIIGVNDVLGNNFIANMQGTTKTIYDTLLIEAGRNTYEFFKDTNSRNFPFCNVKNDSLSVAESLSVQRFSLSILQETEAGFVLIPLDQALSSIPEVTNLSVSELQLTIANDVVMKPIQVSNSLPSYNKTAYNANSNVYEFNTDLVIPPQLDFSFQLRTLPIAPPTGDVLYLRLIVEGVGAQFSGKTNF